MNPKPPTSVTLNLTFSGQVTINPEDIATLLQQLVANRDQQPSTQPTPEISQVVPRRLAYSTKEAAMLLGICNGTLYRLLRRGLLRSSQSCRTKIIAHTEIERFLRETSRSEY
jgi:excisionase family DNA binding protein